MKKKLAFVILVVLALASFNILSLPHARAQTATAQVVTYSWYTAPSTTTTAEYINDLVAVGEVQNTGSTTIGSVWVIGQAYDSNGTFLASTEAQAMEANLSPNQKAPFYLDFIPENSVTQDQSWVSNAANITVLVATITNATSSPYAGVVASGLNAVNNGGTYTVTGTIQNTGSQSVGDIAAIATFYNANNTVVAVSFTDLGVGLVQGQSTTFSVTPWDNTGTLSGEIASYAVQVQSTPVAPIATSEPTAAPTTQPTYSTNPTQNTGETSPTAIYELVIALVVVVIAVVAVLVLFRKRGKSRRIEAPAPTAESSAQL